MLEELLDEENIDYRLLVEKCKENSLQLIDDLLNNDDYLKLMCAKLDHLENNLNEDLILNNKKYMTYVLAYAISLDKVNGYKLAPIVNENRNNLIDYLHDTLENLDSIIITVNNEAYHGIYRNCNYIDKSSHPFMLPYLYVLMLDNDNFIISYVLKANIKDVMNNIGMINMTNKDNYDYFFSNYDNYQLDTISDKNLMNELGKYFYYTNRLHLEEQIKDIDNSFFVFIDILKSKDMILSYGNKDMFYQEDELINLVDYIKENQHEFNNTKLINLIKLVCRYFNRESDNVMEFKRKLRKIIRKRQLEGKELTDEIKPLEFYIKMLQTGMELRGWNKHVNVYEIPCYPKKSFMTKYNSYTNNTYIIPPDITYYRFFNEEFIETPMNLEDINNKIIADIYIATAVYYIIFVYDYSISNFSISTMI